MTILVFAIAWYLAVIGLVFVSVALGRSHRKAAQALSPDESYEDRRRHDRAAHLARVREEELAEMRRNAGGERRWPSRGARA
jgi:hypothetical protein